jgi:hypothetical protein
MTKHIERRTMAARLAWLGSALVILIAAARSGSPELGAPADTATSSVVGGSSKAIDVFAVGARGTIFHYDGTAWSQPPSGLLAISARTWAGRLTGHNLDSDSESPRWAGNGPTSPSTVVPTWAIDTTW